MDVPAALCHQQTTAPTMTLSNSRGEERRKTEDGRLTHSRPHRTRPAAPHPRLDAAPRAATYPRLVIVGAFGAQLGVALRGFSNANGYRRRGRRKNMKEGEKKKNRRTIFVSLSSNARCRYPLTIRSRSSEVETPGVRRVGMNLPVRHEHMDV